MQAVGPGTRKAYRSASNAFLQFYGEFAAAGPVARSFEDLPEEAASEAVAVAFLAWLSGVKRLAPRTCEMYRAGVASCFGRLGYTGYVLGGSRPKGMVKGIQRVYAHRQRLLRPAFTPQQLSSLLSFVFSPPGRALLPSNFPSPELFKVVCLWLFFGVFRVSEVLASSVSGRGLRLGDVRFRPIGVGQGAPVRDLTHETAFAHRGPWLVDVDVSKVDRQGAGRASVIARLGGLRCPAAALDEYLRVRRSWCREGRWWVPSAPLFVGREGCAFTDRAYNSLLAAVAKGSGIPFAEAVRSHSGRIGGASCARAAGVSGDMVKLAGDWTGDPGRMGYIRTAARQLEEMQAAVNAAPEPVFLQASRKAVRSGAQSASLKRGLNSRHGLGS